MPKLERRLWIDYHLGGLLYFILKPAVILLGRLLRRNHDLAGVSRITFLKLLGGGSIVMAYPALLALKQQSRIKKLTMVATPKTAPFARILGIFDEILIIRDDSLLHLSIDSLKAIFRLLRAPAIIDFEIHSRLSTIFCLFTLAMNRIGAYTENSFWRRGISTHLIYYNKASPVYTFYDQAASLFGAPIPPFHECIALFRTHLQSISMTPSNTQADIALAPCCSDLGRERMLPLTLWPQAINEALARNPNAQNLHLLGGPADRLFLDSFIQSITPQLTRPINCINHAGQKKLEESVTLLRSCSELLCIDSALLHLARLLGIHTTSYWGPTDPATRLRPSTVSHDRVHYQPPTCSPCVHITNEAPCKGNNICMTLAILPNAPLPKSPLWLAEGTLNPKRI